MKQIKITNHQLYALTANGSLGGAVMIMASALTAIAKQDAWLSAFLTPVLGLPVIWIYWFLGSQYPGLTFVEITKKILGRWIGTVAAASYVLICFTLAYHLPWYISDFITTQAMPETPSYVISLLFVLAVVIAILYGIETIARVSELYIRFVLVMSVLTLLLVSPNINFENLQPILENGIIPVFKGSYFLACFILFPIITVLMIYPANTDNVSVAKKAIIKGFLVSGFIVFTSILMSVLVLGSKISASLQYPTYLLAKEIRLGIIFTRLEFIIAGTWIITQFMVAVLCFYAGLTGLSQLVGLKDHKRIVLPMGLVILLLSEIVFPDVIYQTSWISLVWLPYATTHGLFLPLLLLIVHQIKSKILKAI